MDQKLASGMSCATSKVGLVFMLEWNSAPPHLSTGTATPSSTKIIQIHNDSFSQMVQGLVIC